MDLTTGKLKEILNDVADNCSVGILYYGDKVMDCDYLKRVLLLTKEGERPLLLFNPMGTHYFDLVEKEGWKVEEHWDKD